MASRRASTSRGDRLARLLVAHDAFDHAARHELRNRPSRRPRRPRRSATAARSPRSLAATSSVPSLARSIEVARRVTGRSPRRARRCLRRASHRGAYPRARADRGRIGLTRAARDRALAPSLHIRRARGRARPRRAAARGDRREPLVAALTCRFRRRPTGFWYGRRDARPPDASTTTPRRSRAAIPTMISALVLVTRRTTSRGAAKFLEAARLCAPSTTMHAPDDPARPRRREERDDIGDLLGRAEPAERQLALDHVGDAGGVGLLPAIPAAAGEQDRARARPS